ncbi:MAG: hypothetical protein AB7G15_09260 [Alphaproteobacteria bacterium]
MNDFLFFDPVFASESCVQRADAQQINDQFARSALTAAIAGM